MRGREGDGGKEGERERVTTGESERILFHNSYARSC